MLYSIINRTKEWWQPKAGNLLSAVYLAVLLYKIDFFTTLYFILPAITTILGIGIFGYFFNDFTDLESDRKANKKNMLEKLSGKFRILLFIGAVLLAILPWFFLPFDRFSIYLLVGEFTLLLVYAVPPIRLKEKGFVALVADALYAYAIPFTLAFHTFNLLSTSKENFIIIGVLFAWQLAIGMVNIIIHQIEDFKNDIHTSTKTWVISVGLSKARKYLVLIFWPIMVFSFFYLLALISTNIWQWYFLIPALYLGIQFAYIFSKKSLIAFLNSNISADLQKINIHYHLFFPYWHVLLLVFIDVKFVYFLIGHYVLFNFKSVFWWIKYIIYPNFLIYLVEKIPSKVINYSIYYFRILLLRETPKKARREHHDNYIKAKQDLIDKKSKPNVALVSANKNKYTETFLNQHEKFLLEGGYYLHRLYGGYLPTIEFKRGPLLSKNESVAKFMEWKSAFFDLDNEDNLKEAFVNYLINNNINLVVAEFGQSGAEISNLCQAAGVPLIVVFYGYDAHHKKVIEAYQDKYTKMFNYASKIIGVSKDILTKLEALGAPKNKLFYLPCAIDTNRFSYSEHSKNDPIFLTVGRFAETKSPHLSILAFNEVLKEIPNARLIMIGKDGGGELFEACVILVKALKIENSVIFKGICTPDEVKECMKSARVFIQHSVTTPLNSDKEGTPVAIMEAMTSGLPVISTKHAGIEDLIVSGENGFLVDEYDYLAMANLMVKVAQDEELVSKIGQNAASSIRENVLIQNNKNLFLEEVNKYILKND
jgi:colanic acid/amylovoran biosynthesis glycosyltransferase